MTLIATAVRRNFVLSVSDRRTTVLQNGSYQIRDERFNKHVWFALHGPPGRDVMVKGGMTFTGVAEFAIGPRRVSTDQLIADALSSLGNQPCRFSDIFEAVADELDTAARHACIDLKTLGLTIIGAGFTTAFQEPWYIVMSNTGVSPDVTENDVVATARIREYDVFFVVPMGPRLILAGSTDGLDADGVSQMQQVVRKSGVRPIDMARLIVREIRKGSRQSAVIGDRVSAIVAPANGVLDSALWDREGEPFRTAMPRVVYPNGTQWAPSEMEMELDFMGRPKWYALLGERHLRGKVSRRKLRKLRRTEDVPAAPTVWELLAFALFGEEWNDAW